MAQSLRTKSGVECIDVNDFLLEMFIKVGYDQILEESEVADLKKSDFKRVSKDISDLKDIVKTLNSRVTKDQEYSSDENLDDAALAAQAAKEKTEPAPTTPPVAEQPDIDPAAAEMAAGAEPEGATPEEQESLGNPPELPAEDPEAEEDEDIRDLGSQEDYANDIGALEDMIAQMADEFSDDDDDEKEVK